MFVEGVRESGGAIVYSQKHSCILTAAGSSLPPGRGEAGILVSTRGRGLSRGLIERDDGAREAVTVSFEPVLSSDMCSHPPLPSRFMGRPPITGVWPAAAPRVGVGAFEDLSLLICALTCWKCLSYSHAACCRRKGCVTPNSSALEVECSVSSWSQSV